MANLGSCGGACSGSGVNDAVCVSAIVEDDTTAIEIWENTTLFKMNGTIIIENKGDTDGNAWGVEVLVNGVVAPELTVQPGETKALTVNPLKKIEIQGVTGTPVPTDASPVNISFSLNYKF